MRKMVAGIGQSMSRSMGMGGYGYKFYYPWGTSLLQ